eukprot:521500_1
MSNDSKRKYYTTAGVVFIQVVQPHEIPNGPYIKHELVQHKTPRYHLMISGNIIRGKDALIVLKKEFQSHDSGLWLFEYLSKGSILKEEDILIANDQVLVMTWLANNDSCCVIL